MRRIIFLLVAIVLIGTQAFAQTTISGTVTDSNGEAVPGASVRVKGYADLGTITDLNGQYSINAPTEATALIFTFVGMQMLEVEIAGQTTINATLENEDVGIDEVIVVAYGQQKRSEVTGSVVTVSGEKLEKIQESDMLAGLDGQISGVQIIQDNGQPGEAPSIRIRGIGSISGSSAPLYVVDGVPFNGDINTIDPMDVSSISVLKDASANALYGHRGANGVIIVTTKRGKTSGSGGLTITADVSMGVSARGTKDYDILTDPAEYYAMFYQASRNNLIVNEGMTADAASAMAAANLITDTEGLGYQLGYNNYDVADNLVLDPLTGKVSTGANLLYQEDWSDFLFDNSTKTKAYVNIAGGTENSSYFFSLGYDSNEGYAIKSGFDRYTARLTLDQKVGNHVELGGTLNYAHTDQDAPIQNYGSGTYANLFNWARIIAPIYPVQGYDAGGNPVFDSQGNRIYDFGDGANGQIPWVRTLGGTQNPYATTNFGVQSNIYDSFSGRFYGKLKFLKDFTFTFNTSADYSNGNLTNFSTPIGGDAKNAGGRSYAYSTNRFTVTNQQLLDWGKTFGAHSIKVLIGHESSKYNYRYLRAHKTNFLLPNQYVLDGAAVIEDVTNYERDYHVEGYLSRITYDFDDKYIVNLSFRRDGSSVFHPDNRWGNFWGAGVAYNVSKEDFMSSISFINNLKLKASFGQQGNDIVIYPSTTTRNYYAYRDQYKVVNSGGNPGIGLAYLGNKDLTWEKSDNYNFGFESVLWNNRIKLDFEYFIRKVTDLIYNAPLPMSSGAPSIPKNIGDMENKGIEINLGITAVKTDDLTVEFNFNGTHYKNEITNLPQESIDDGTFQLEVGKSRYDYYSRVFIGVNPENGNAIWQANVLDENGEPTGELTQTEVYSDADEYFLDRTAIPDLYGGFGAFVGYKNFDLNIGFSYQVGGYGYDGVYYNLFDASDPGQNFVKDAWNTWTPENANATLPRIDPGYPDNYYASSMYLVDASYFSLKNITLGYTLPNSLLDKFGIKSLRIYAVGNNLFLWSRRQGFDPRMSVTGLSSNEYSVMRTISFGVNLKF